MGVEEQRRQSPAHTYLHHLAHVGPRASKRRCFQNRVEIKVGCNEEKKNFLQNLNRQEESSRFWAKYMTFNGDSLEKREIHNHYPV